MMVQFSSSFEPTMDFQRTTESFRRLTWRSSASFSSKQDIGAKNRMAWTSSKYGSHACRWIERQPAQKGSIREDLLWCARRPRRISATLCRGQRCRTVLEGDTSLERRGRVGLVTHWPFERVCGILARLAYVSEPG